MAYSRVTYIGDGSNTIFTVPFEYLKKSFVKVVVAEEPVPSENFEWLTSTSIKLAVAPAAGSTIYIYRDTEKEAPVTGYRDGSVLTGSDLDNQTRQLLHIAQETQDVADEQMRLDSHDLKYDAQSRVIKNVADPVDDTDAMTYRAWKQDIQPALDASLVNATIKANQAEASAVGANSSALLASGQATISGQHARESEASAAASAQSAVEAKIAAEVAKEILPENWIPRVQSLEAFSVAENGRMDAVETKNTQQDARLDAVEAKNTQQDARLNGAETSLAGKLNADMSNRPAWSPHLVSTWTKGTSWYRKYSDGFIEQGGYLGVRAEGSLTVTFPIPFAGASYVLNVYAFYAEPDSGHPKIEWRNSSGFCFRKTTGSVDTNWYAAGY